MKPAIINAIKYLSLIINVIKRIYIYNQSQAFICSRNSLALCVLPIQHLVKDAIILSTNILLPQSIL